MGVIIGCTAYEAWMAHYDLIGRSHVLRLANGRVFYDEIMLSRSRILITRTKAERGDVVTVDRYIQPDTPVELVPMEPRKSAPAAIRVPSVAVEVPVTNGSQTRQDTPKSSATGKQVTLTNPPIIDWILRAKIDAALDELNWRQMSTNHLWLDMTQEGCLDG